MEADSTPTAAQDADFFKLMERHLPRGFIWVMRHLPSEPRCRLCKAPYGGIGGRVMRRFGYGPSRKNPSLCNTCFEEAPMGGVEMEIGVLFADVRGFTSLAETMAPTGVADLLNRFTERFQPTSGPWFHRSIGVHVFDLRVEKVESRGKIPASVLGRKRVDSPDQLDVLLRHRPASIAYGKCG